MPATIVRDARFLEHAPSEFHPESPERLRGIDRALAESPGIVLTEVPARFATREEVERAHSKAYLDFLESKRGRAVSLDPDTATSPGSVDAAFLAAGATIELFTRIAKKECAPGIALVRPPGHHALPDRAMGFCLLNNVAIAAHALLASGLAQRIAIYDWDVHHGNGTQDMFWEDPRVLYMSTHQWPFYPGTGDRDERGGGRAEGATLNLPLPAGTGDALMIEATERVLIPATKTFAPDVILISAGFDPFIEDPLGGFAVTIDGFRQIAARWRDAAEEICGGRIAGVLEGGYHIEGLGAAVRAVLTAWNT
jgi:acetoin utilization deacetylase AcuC-like enzyme